MPAPGFWRTESTSDVAAERDRDVGASAGGCRPVENITAINALRAYLDCNLFAQPQRAPDQLLAGFPGVRLGKRRKYCIKVAPRCRHLRCHTDGAAPMFTWPRMTISASRTGSRASMGNCFRSDAESEQSQLANRLAETTDAADAKYTALGTQMHTLVKQRERMFEEVQTLKKTQPTALRDITNAIRNNKPIPIRHQPLHLRLQQLDNNLDKTDRDIAGIQQFMQRIQLQRSTAASLGQQAEQVSMYASWGNLMTSLGINTRAVIEEQAKLETAVEDMDEMRQAVQYGVRDAITSSSGGGGISRISQLLTEIEEDDVTETNALATTSANAPLGIWNTDSDGGSAVELVASQRPRAAGGSGVYAAVPTGKKSVQDILGS